MTEKTSTLFDQSYQPWDSTGKLQPHPFRVIVIAWMGIRNVFKRSPVAVLLLSGLAILFSIPNAFLGLMMPGIADPSFLVSASLSSSMSWTFLLVVPLVGSGLVASDIKHNALLMYFSKSILRVDYVAGKAMTAFVYLLLPLLLAPLLAAGVALYGMGEQATNLYSAKLFLATMLCAPIAVLPGIAIIMAFSACTRRTFLAGLGWVILYLILESVSAILFNAGKLKWGYLVSISNNVFRVAQAVMPSPPEGYKVPPMPPEMDAAAKFVYSPWLSAAILAGLFAVGLSIVLWRISNTERRS